MVKFKQLVNTSILDSEEWIGFFGDSEYKNKDEKIVMGYWSFDGIDNDLLPKLSNTYEMELSEDEINGQKGYTLLNNKGSVCLITLYYRKDGDDAL